MRIWTIRALTVMLSIMMVGAFTLSMKSVARAQNDDESDQTDIQEILDNTEDYMDQHVTVTGRVNDLVSSRAFTLTDDDTDGELLVGAPGNEMPADIGDDDLVEVSGTLRMFDPDDPNEWSQSIGINPEAGVYGEFEDAPILVANTVSMQGQQDDDEDDDGTDVAADRILLADVFADFDTLRGETITVVGEVEDILTPRAMSISSGDVGDELLVAGAANAIPNSVTEDGLVRVTGTLESFDPDDPFEWGGDDIGIDPEDDVFSEWEDEPVVVVDTLTVLVPALGQMVDNIVDDPDAYVGETVTVLGRVNEVIDPLRSFTLDGTEGWLGITEDNLLVVGPSNIVGETDLLLDDDAIVRATGTVRYFDPDDPFEFGSDDLDNEEEDIFFDDEDYSEWEDDEVLVIESMDVLVVNQGETIENILDDTEAYMGVTVTVVGNINDLLTDQAMTLEGTDGFLGIGDDNLLVVGATDVVQPELLEEDVIVVVTGTIREFDPDDPFEFGSGQLGDDEDGEEFLVDEADFSEWEDDEVLVADSVTPIAVD